MRSIRSPGIVASAAVLSAVCLGALTGCASGGGAGAGSQGPGAWPTPAPPTGYVAGQGMVMDIAGEVELCMGAIMESYPPQCTGIPLGDWSWDGLDGYESSGDVRWGMFAVQGAYDDEALTVTKTAIPLALYDPIAAPDPTGGKAGAGTEASLEAARETITAELGDAVLMSGLQLADQPDGWLRVLVTWDDGTWQREADAEFGDRVVLIESALRTLGE